ncbi:MAG: hypothetical protein ABJB03_00525 [Rhodoglobus sp.]
MKIKNVSPVGDLDLPLIGRTVLASEVFEVPKDQALLLLEQPDNFREVKPRAATPRKPAAATTSPIDATEKGAGK